MAQGDSLTDRAKEVMTNVRDFVMSYNFDESDPMTDYFHTNFYLTLGIGSYRQPYRMELPKITGKDTPEVFRYPEGPAHKAMRQALGKARFGFIESRKHIGEMILGEDFYGSQGEHYFWPKEYSSAKTAQKRIGKLEAAGMHCELTGCNDMPRHTGSGCQNTAYPQIREQYTRTFQIQSDRYSYDKQGNHQRTETPRLQPGGH